MNTLRNSIQVSISYVKNENIHKCVLYNAKRKALKYEKLTKAESIRRN